MATTNWYYTKEEIEKNSPSRVDGIDLRQESFQRWSYTTFLQELGMRLRHPQKTISSAIIFCQRFFTRQSLAKNDPKTISIVCMFIAGKVEESPRPVGDVIAVAYQVLHQRQPSKEVYERLKETVLTGEKFVLSTLDFDLKLGNPYKNIVLWVKRSVKTERDSQILVQAAWNFINDGLRTSLCLQFRPKQIAAAALYLGSVFAKLKWDVVKILCEDFDVTKTQLCVISDQTLDVYTQDFLIPGMKADRKETKDDETKSFQGLEDHQGDKGCVINVAYKSAVCP